MSLIVRVSREVTQLEVWRSNQVMAAVRALLAEGVRVVDEPQAYEDPGASEAFRRAGAKP